MFCIVENLKIVLLKQILELSISDIFDLEIITTNKSITVLFFFIITTTWNSECFGCLAYCSSVSYHLCVIKLIWIKIYNKDILISLWVKNLYITMVEKRLACTYIPIYNFFGNHI